jgi:hypothetical protein
VDDAAMSDYTDTDRSFGRCLCDDCCRQCPERRQERDDMRAWYTRRQAKYRAYWRGYRHRKIRRPKPAGGE